MVSSVVITLGVMMIRVSITLFLIRLTRKKDGNKYSEAGGEDIATIYSEVEGP
jgi:hypothetical protein